VSHRTWNNYWTAIRRHKLFVVILVIFGPVFGYFLNPDEGFLYGWAISILAIIWLWDGGDDDSMEAKC
jgi:hypothetical protein